MMLKQRTHKTKDEHFENGHYKRKILENTDEQSAAKFLLCALTRALFEPPITDPRFAPVMPYSALTLWGSRQCIESSFYNHVDILRTGEEPIFCPTWQLLNEEVKNRSTSHYENTELNSKRPPYIIGIRSNLKPDLKRLN